MAIGEVSLNQLNSKWYMSPQYCAWTASLVEKQMRANAFETTGNKKGLNYKKLGVGIGVTALSVLGAVLGIRNGRSNYIKESQKLFQELFFDRSITKEQTVEMLKRYKEIAKIKDKKEYVDALYKETKKNFKLGNELVYEYNDKLAPTMGGNSFILTDTIEFNPAWTRENLTNAVFHELRHAKQDYIAINSDIDRFFESFNIKPEKRGHIIPYLQRKCGLTTFGKENIPEGVEDSFIEKCFNAYKTYFADKKSASGYKENFLEKDAWFAGDRGMALMNDWRLMFI